MAYLRLYVGYVDDLIFHLLINTHIFSILLQVIIFFLNQCLSSGLSHLCRQSKKLAQKPSKTQKT